VQTTIAVEGEKEITTNVKVDTKTKVEQTVETKVKSEAHAHAHAHAHINVHHNTDAHVHTTETVTEGGHSDLHIQMKESHGNNFNAHGATVITEKVQGNLHGQELLGANKVVETVTTTTKTYTVDDALGLNLAHKGFKDCKRCLGYGFYNSSINGQLKSCAACVERANDCALCNKTGFWVLDKDRHCGCKFGNMGGIITKTH